MSYIRPAKVEEVVKWLLENGYAEDKAGFGHVDATTLAEALVDEWDLVGVFSKPS